LWIAAATAAGGDMAEKYNRSGGVKSRQTKKARDPKAARLV
jgi:hypothetical protein